MSSFTAEAGGSVSFAEWDSALLFFVLHLCRLRAARLRCARGTADRESKAHEGKLLRRVQMGKILENSVKSQYGYFTWQMK